MTEKDKRLVQRQINMLQLEVDKETPSIQYIHTTANSLLRLAITLKGPST